MTNNIYVLAAYILTLLYEYVPFDVDKSVLITTINIRTINYIK